MQCRQQQRSRIEHSKQTGIQTFEGIVAMEAVTSDLRSYLNRSRSWAPPIQSPNHARPLPTCRVCSETFPMRTNLFRHLRRAGHFSGTSSGSDSSSRSPSHSRRYRKRTFRCAVCHSAFRSRSDRYVLLQEAGHLLPDKRRGSTIWLSRAGTMLSSPRYPALRSTPAPIVVNAALPSSRPSGKRARDVGTVVASTGEAAGEPDPKRRCGSNADSEQPGRNPAIPATLESAPTCSQNPSPAGDAGTANAITPKEQPAIAVLEPACPSSTESAPPAGSEEPEEAQPHTVCRSRNRSLRYHSRLPHRHCLLTRKPCSPTRISCTRPAAIRLCGPPRVLRTAQKMRKVALRPHTTARRRRTDKHPPVNAAIGEAIENRGLCVCSNRGASEGFKSRQA